MRGSLLRRPAVAAAVLIAVCYGALAMLLPHPAPTFDEAKYLAIGVNALEGHGPRTAFGILFLPHSPFWPMVFAAPQAALRASAWPWGHLLNAIAAAATLLLTAWLARPFGQRAMLLAEAGLVAWLSLFGLARTARLDVPEAALALAYLAVASSAIDAGTVRRGVLAGALFAWAFLVKEASLVLLAAPFLAAVAGRRPLGSIARAGGLVLLTAVPLVSWWFGWYAGQTGRVYAFGLGAGMLLPLAGALAALGVALVALGSGPGRARVLPPIERRLAGRRAALAVAGAMLAAWVVAFLIAFSRSEVQAGRPLLDVPNILRWARAWAVDLSPVLLIALGLVGAVRAAARGDDRPLPALVAVVAGLPWLLLVAVQGEPPRNDIALISLAAVAGAAGWLELPGALAGRDRLMAVAGAAAAAVVALVVDLQLAHLGVATRITRHTLGLGGSALLGAAVGGAAASAPGRRWLLARLQRGWPSGTSPLLLRGVAVAAIAVLSVAVLGVAAPATATDTARSSTTALADEVSAWLEGQVPDGATVMFGSVLANQVALLLDGRYQLRSLQADLGIADASAPLGIRVGSRAPSDIVAIDRHPRQDAYLVFSAATALADLRRAQPSVWVYTTGLDTSAPSAVAWLATVPGIRLATVLDSPRGMAPALQAHIYWVDAAALGAPSARTFASSAAVNALLDGLGTGPQARAVAAALLARVTISDGGPAADAALARLRATAGQ